MINQQNIKGCTIALIYQQNREKLVAYQIAYRKAHPEKYQQIKLRSAIRLLQKHGYTVIDPNGKDAEL
uniref:Uncharacterized protein n=1 Tax=Siphoviridae sp. ctrvp54 TaxID=2825690 RepID=A0A8S5P8D0_9CAUD|nr:MAG TPA: hypothetical protein [Siphoviridae sp. ctrvp54]